MLVLVLDMYFDIWCWCSSRIWISLFGVGVSVGYANRVLVFVSVSNVFRYFVFGLVSNMDIDF